MAVSDIIKRFYGTYQATGFYSFEFRSQKTGRPITEIVLMLPPESVQVTEKQRAELIPTLTGGYYCDFGQDFKEINVTGSIHFYYVGSPLRPNSSNAGDPTIIDGYTEFLKLRFMLSRYRDYTMTPKGRLIAPSFIYKMGTINVEALKRFVQTQKKGLATDIQVIWHDYDYDEHYEVKVDSFVMSRDKTDPFTVKYDINMKGFQVDTRRKSTAHVTKAKKLPTPEAIDLQAQLIQYLHPESTPAAIPAFDANQLTTALPNPMPSDIDYATIVQDVYLLNLNEKLKVLRAYLLWANGMIQSGVMDVETAMKSINEQDLIAYRGIV